MSDAIPERDLFGARSHEYVLPAAPYVSRCGSCNAPMAWTKTKAGNAVPLSLATVEERDGVKYAVSHFCDCPNANEWRKK